jgi:hypothetical protein
MPGKGGGHGGLLPFHSQVETRRKWVFSTMLWLLYPQKPGHGTLFIGKPYKKRVDDLLKLSRHLLKTAVAIFTGHAPVRKHLVIMGLLDGDLTCRFCRKETETVHHIICCYETLVRQCYNVLGICLSNQKI